jgi:hypothetical protein
MVSESYDSWTLMIAVPKTPQMEELLRSFHDVDDGEFTRLDVHAYDRHLAIEIYCEFDYEGPAFSRHEDSHEDLAELLVDIRAEILQGNVSFLQAVAEFYAKDSESGKPAQSGKKRALSRAARTIVESLDRI